MKKSAICAVLLSLACVGQASADGLGAIRECITNANGLTFSEQLMSLTSCLRTVPSPWAQKFVACVDDSVGDNLQETVGKLQYCLLSLDTPHSQFPLMLNSIYCVKTARGETVPARIDTAKRCLNRIPYY